MSAKPTPERKPKAPGRNVKEWERKTERVMLRMPREMHGQLEQRAGEEEMTAAAYVLRLVRTDLGIV